ncbi:MAG TPA: DUF2142 domain-containing protein, partial [Pseudolysinimonas sp.]|nr:DUF2142 domain-containing protein [Pseudolysinimonas sp.]
LVDINCFTGDTERSAACQDGLWASDTRTDTDRGNWRRQYPPVYYAVNGLLAGADVQTSALMMRLFAIVLFLGLTISIYVLQAPRRRPALLWTWLLSTLPLGLSLFGSNNPSTWAFTGVGSAFFALLGWYEATGRRRVALGALFAVSVMIAAGSRGDAAIFVGLAIAAVMVLKIARTRSFLLRSILPVVMGLIALLFFLSARQVSSGIGGFSGGSNGGAGEISGGLEGAALLLYNLVNVPFIWTGVLGTWGLGWLDVSLPWVVPLGVVAVFAVVCFTALATKERRVVFVALGVFAVLWALPVYVLQQGGDVVGEQVQPRYLLPLIVLLAAVLMLTPEGRILRLTRLQAVLIAATLTGAHLIALHFTIRRYVTGIDGASPNLDAGAEWWWNGVPGPTAVWLIGAAAYGALMFLLIPRLVSADDPVRIAA